MTDCGAVATGSMETGAVEIGCGVPRGFRRLEPSPDPARLAELRAVLAGRAAEVLAAQQHTVGLLVGQGVLFCALGLHRGPGSADEVRPSVLTLAAGELGGVAPGPLLAELLARARGTAEGGAGSRPLELPAGPAAVLLGRGSGTPPRFDGAAAEPPGRLWAGTVALASAAHDRLVLLQLTSACPELGADYRAILLATAHTLTLSGPPRSRIRDALG